MKRFLLAAVTSLIAMNASAHQFWPESYEIMRPANGQSAMFMAHLNSEVDAKYQLSIFKDKDAANAKNLGSKQLVFAGSNIDFPIVVPSKYLQGNSFTICSLQIAKSDTMQKQVCLRINVI